MRAARAVFNTPELLELIFLHCSVKSLACALSVSKYCRVVVLRSTELRRTLFLEPAPAAEHLELVHVIMHPGGSVEGVRRSIIEEPSETSQVVAKAHPMLIPMEQTPDYSFAWSLYRRFTHILEPKTMEQASRSALLFQPPSLRVSFVCHGQAFFVERAEGVTFGAVFDHLDQERKRCQRIVNETAQLPNLVSPRAAYMNAAKLLQGPLRDDWSSCPSGSKEQYVYFKATDLVMDDSRDVSIARHHPGFAGL